ncbi:hypothetical protein JYK00_04325 [Thermosipho ferrireducens]|uniref:Uncharacterized protein n=1 Tax=Thermosipho ferrireducens TaxID=2571116 RepID=A0ABX7S830_9BACT|nr:hypothetical protein [Thermosipho ferrireducens]QTA38741.1 hypothetical protein JYK00_04325 [Thermosipho ferrireducens]
MLVEIFVFLIIFLTIRYLTLKFLGYTGKSTLLRNDDFWSVALILLIIVLSILSKNIYIYYGVISIGLFFNFLNYLDYKITLKMFCLNILIFSIMYFPEYIWISGILVVYKIWLMKKIPIYNWVYITQFSEKVAESCEKGNYTKKPIVILAKFNKNAIVHGKGIIINIKNDKAIFRISKKTHKILGEPNLNEFCQKISEHIRRWLNDKSGKSN